MLDHPTVTPAFQTYRCPPRTTLGVARAIAKAAARPAIALDAKYERGLPAADSAAYSAVPRICRLSEPGFAPGQLWTSASTLPSAEAM